MVPRQMADTRPKIRRARGKPTLAKAPGSASRPAPKRPDMWFDWNWVVGSGADLSTPQFVACFVLCRAYWDAPLKKMRAASRVLVLLWASRSPAPPAAAPPPAPPGVSNDELLGVVPFKKGRGEDAKDARPSSSAPDGDTAAPICRGAGFRIAL